MASIPNNFTPYDYVVFVLTIVASIGIGIFFALRGGQKTQGDFLLGGRKMSVIPIAISMMVSFQSAILVLGTPAEMYSQGTEFMTTYIGSAFGFLFGGLFFVPLIYPLGFTSVLEYLDKRFQSYGVRLFGTFLMIAYQIIYMGVAAFAPAIAFEAVTGFPVWISLLVAGLVTTFYTTVGGIKAVVWTDVFQAGIMLIGMLAILIQGTLKVGGFNKVWELNRDWERVRFFTVDVDPRVRHTAFGTTIGYGLQTMVLGIHQATVQRYCSVPTLRGAQATMILNVVINAIPFALACMTGVVMFAYYANQDCDPLSQGLVDDPNQLIPYFVMEILSYPCVPGIFMASLFAGALSTMSSCLTSLGAITWEDLIKPSLGERLTEYKRTVLIKILVAIFGVLSIGVSFMATYMPGTVIQITHTLFSPLTGTMVGLFLLGGFVPIANKWGALAGGIVGLAISTWQAVGSYVTGIENLYLDLPVPDGTCGLNFTVLTFTEITVNETATSNALQDFYSISYLWVNVIALVICFVLGLLVSLITYRFIPEEDRLVPTMYLIPFMSRIMCCLPRSCLYYLDCCRAFDKPQEIIDHREKLERAAQKTFVGDDVQETTIHEPDDTEQSYSVTVMNATYDVKEIEDDNDSKEDEDDNDSKEDEDEIKVISVTPLAED